MGVRRVTPRRVVALSIALIFLGMVVAAVGVHMLGGLAAGLIAYGAVAVVTGLATVALWA